MTDTTEAVTTEFLRRLSVQDAHGLAELFADEIDWNVPGEADLPWTGRRSRQDQVAEYFGLLWQAFVAGESTAAVDKVVIDGAEVVVLGTFAHTAVSTGKRFETPVAMHLTVTEGKIVRLHLYEDTLAVSKAFEA
ncbi:hypothetical protein Ais01nite_28610 [Asanoa ishikariensis]|uniref:SnoaL-like domain-containing protein n=1 Tax=Asanoa ishikariensis TaxID=137265 RepID=A0A1H3QPL6_9ACTN|nr:nuclear transport factor 2 family protein [Asanoa ishikariensis]GIF64826.1 hypothetical protein Ais01nite_28610 [Asanoa ishikariensis]SDZ15223.1 hypothetical protein SAMN05421684_3061 [Asanoa ishikariensis]